MSGKPIKQWTLTFEHFLAATRSPRQHGECFHIYWRDKEHPDFVVLPPSYRDTAPAD